ncbi:TPA: class I SAM-dependent methyltransferase [Legionella pneumophila]|nr:class I SAM-dependent methyltransferase [Legionella pneumophila]HAT3884939.1 class I SAM-dependent methyltransferase [Legionella pneumophila]HAU2318486.1 class I SAM-dependent methyltransferase [Legionella pneumophila]HAU2318978.1 class I SAM-dependent methyltransferase [Legionella pneumophila]HEC4727603.1 class I SAM-dependent methyltransferase [Legionella pneumophila]
MVEKNKDKVYQVYDEIVDWFDDNRTKDLTMEKLYLDFIQKCLKPKSKILDVGCGTGEPIAQFLINEGYDVTGIDASRKMISLCKQRFPKNKWILADMRTLDLNEKFHAVIAWHSFFHLPHDDQRMTLKLLASYVDQNGLLIFTSGPEYDEVWSNNGGHDLYHTSLSTEEYEQILIDNNFKVLAHKIRDPDCGDATVWVAQKASRTY